MTSTEPNIIDWLTLLAALAAVVTTVWATRRSDREIIDAHIDWDWFGSGPIAELPFVYINNRSAHAVEIVELTWYSGALVLKPEEGTALYNEGPEDVNFPYRIPAGDFKKFHLEEHGVRRAFEKVKNRANFFGVFRRSTVWLVIRTIRGKVTLVGAERAIPWRDRPTWVTGKK